MQKIGLLFIFVFIFTIFALATPFDASKTSRDFSRSGASIAEFSKAIKEGSPQRRVALASLALFGIICLLRRMPIRGRVNGMLGLSIVAYLLLTMLSIGWADDPWLTLRRVMILVLLTLGALGIARVLSARDIVTLGLFIAGTTLMTSVIAEIYFGGFSVYSESWRFAGILHPIDQGWNCGIMAISSLAKLKSSSRKRIVYFCSFWVALIFLLLTKSRMPFAATAFGILIYWILTSTRSNKGAILLTVSILSILTYFVLENYIEIFYRLLKTFGRGEEGEASIYTLTGRLLLWKACLHMVAFRPILGYGYNSYLSPQYLKIITAAIGFTPSSLHSGYIETLFSLGITGLVIFILMLALAIKESVKLAHMNHEYTFVVAILVWLCSNLFVEANLLTRPTFPTFYWLILLIKIGFYRNNLITQARQEGAGHHGEPKSMAPHPQSVRRLTTQT